MTRRMATFLAAAAVCAAFLGLAPEAKAQVKLETQLTPPAGGAASGKAKFEDRGVRKKFSTEVERVNRANGTVLTVCVDGTAVGTLTINLGRGDLNRDTANGQAVPAVRRGSVVEVKDGTTVILRGTF